MSDISPDFRRDAEASASPYRLIKPLAEGWPNQHRSKAGRC
jgi:hypothetical protein